VGFLAEDPDRMRRAAAYIEGFNGVQIAEDADG
jgi:hypothetical protein